MAAGMEIRLSRVETREHMHVDMDSLPILLCLFLLVVVPPVAAAQAQQQKQMPSFSATDGVWRPTDSNRTLVSANGDFAAGFVPSTSTPGTGRYRFAVWVVVGSNSTDRSVIWHAHNDTASYSACEGDGNSTLAVDAAGGLSWTAAGADKPIWSPVAKSSAAVLRLNDAGSLVYGGAAWSSFAEPTDTLMAGQATPYSNGTITGTTLQSANGRYRLINAATLVLNNNSVMYVYYNISKYGTALLNLTADGTLMFAFNGWEFPNLIASDQGSTKLVRRLTLDNDGNLRLYSVVPGVQQWRVVWQAVQDSCTIRGTCAAGRICVPVGVHSVDCICPPGYRNSTREGPCAPKKNYSGRGDDDSFVRMDFVFFSGGATNRASIPGPLMEKLPPQNQEDCESMCRKNASCVAYGYKLGGDRTCLRYTALVDGYWSPATEISTYLRVVASDKDSNPFTGMTSKLVTVCPRVKLEMPVPPKQARTTDRNVAVMMALFVVDVLAGALSLRTFQEFRRKYRQYQEMACTLELDYLPSGGARRFSYAELKAATRDFSDVVGRGAYGTVYRGELADRRAVAVKQLMHGVGGGDAEFWAEATIIGRMHHLNLVRMWGFCADREHRMLVYEYVPNGSLDKYLFGGAGAAGGGAAGGGGTDDEQAQEPPPLDPDTRYRIALGVARAIAYLHEECLEWVLHCDIKPENILLEDDFCPKVSDFGVSKLISISKRDKVTMSGIRGTRGYMAPEWVIHSEPITAKADVYSFGMVLLEMVSGRRSYKFRQESAAADDDDDWYFPKWAYEKVYVERRIDDILDPRIAAVSYDATVERMVKTAMWCLQDRAEMRPSMGRVAKMLEGSVEINDPVKPTFFFVQEYYSEASAMAETPHLLCSRVDGSVQFNSTMAVTDSTHSLTIA